MINAVLIIIATPFSLTGEPLAAFTDMQSCHAKREAAEIILRVSNAEVEARCVFLYAAPATSLRPHKRPLAPFTSIRPEPRP